METRSAGRAGDAVAPGQLAEITESGEITVAHSFSITGDGVIKGAIGAGVGYQCKCPDRLFAQITVANQVLPGSISETKGTSRTLTPAPEDEHPDYYSRWVYFPRLIESCGIVQRLQAAPPPNCSGDICGRQMDYGCVGELETIENVCSLVPDRNPAGEPMVMWAVSECPVLNSTCCSTRPINGTYAGEIHLTMSRA
jgi:hypothetical protein